MIDEIFEETAPETFLHPHEIPDQNLNTYYSSINPFDDDADFEDPPPPPPKLTRYYGKEFLGFSHHFAAYFLSTEIAELLTYPLTVINRKRSLRPEKYPSNSATIKEIISSEGARGFFKGLKSNLKKRGADKLLMLPIFFNGLDEIEQIKGEENVTLLDRASMAIGATTTVLLLLHPQEVIKLYQKRREAKLRQAELVIHQIYRTRGLRGLYRGLGHNVLRSSIKTGFDMTTYHQLRSQLGKSFKMEERQRTFVAAALTGIFSSIVISPLEKIKDAFISEGIELENEARPFRSTLEGIKHLHQRIGLRGFYRGFSFACPQGTAFTILMFMSREELETLMASEEFVQFESDVRFRRFV